MANLSISTTCNQACPYCFTGDQQKDAAQSFTSLEEFDRQLEFLDRSDVDEVRLLGGEPTLHPRFTALVERALARGKRLTVFTNGLMPESILERLAALPADRCSVMVNCNDPGPSPDPAHRRRTDVLRRLGLRAHPGFNIYQPDFRLDFLRDLVLRTGCKPVIRLGLAHPLLSGANRSLHPNQYPAVGAKIARFVRANRSSRIRLEMDCGFVRCMFSQRDLELLLEEGHEAVWHCGPILDVDPAGSVIACYPLAGLGALKLGPQSEASAMRAELEEMGRPYRAAGVYAECANCAYRQAGECPGGCLAAAIRRFRPAQFEISVP